MAPSVSISVLNYQRREALREALDGARRQHGPVLELIAVDNASADGSAEMVRDDFPDVRLVRLPENVGAAARNAGVAAAKGDIVVTIDNDVRFTTPDDVERAVEAFARHPGAAVVNFMIVGADGRLSRRDWCHPRDPDRWAEHEFLTDYVLEGASACRRDAFLATGGYWPPFFIGHEGWDLALRLIGAGHDLVYTPTVRVRHLADPSVRPSSRIYYTFARNAVWVALRHHRPLAAARSIAQDLALMAFAAARAGEIRAWARGVRDAVRGAPVALASRQPLPPSASARLAAIRALKPGVLARVRRHVRERLI
ncbi:MAG: glycosyltransferase family 2 protein [Candidatus Rokubacteria bacterium]|nr:glycosyltransferase family 2 protein [Candidatus Rokubacteria bacterium]